MRNVCKIVYISLFFRFLKSRNKKWLNDGTNIESVANKYSFVWKKAVSKNMVKLTEKICTFCAECEELYGIKVVYNDQISLHTLKHKAPKLRTV